MKTFRQLYCERHALDLSRYDHAVLWRSLYPHARLVYWLMLLNRNYLRADLDFIQGVGSLCRRRDFRDEAAEFRFHPGNRGLLRRGLRLRVSASRLRRLFDDVMSTGESRDPIAIDSKAGNATP